MSDEIPEILPYYTQVNDSKPGIFRLANLKTDEAVFYYREKSNKLIEILPNEKYRCTTNITYVPLLFIPRNESAEILQFKRKK